jgi:hypothetical protein
VPQDHEGLVGHGRVTDLKAELRLVVAPPLVSRYWYYSFIQVYGSAGRKPKTAGKKLEAKQDQEPPLYKHAAKLKQK